MRAGQLRKTLRFDRLDTTADAYGNLTGGSWVKLFTKRGEVRSEVGRWVGDEDRDGGAKQSTLTKRIVLRSDRDIRSLTAADSVLIDDVRWNIIWLDNPDSRDREVHILIEQGVPA